MLASCVLSGGEVGFDLTCCTNVLSEDIMLGAVMFGHEEFQPVIETIKELAEKCGKAEREHIVPDHSDLEKKLTKLVGKDVEKAYKISDKQERYNALDAATVDEKELLKFHCLIVASRSHCQFLHSKLRVELISIKCKC